MSILTLGRAAVTIQVPNHSATANFLRKNHPTYDCKFGKNVFSLQFNTFQAFSIAKAKILFDVKT